MYRRPLREWDGLEDLFRPNVPTRVAETEDQTVRGGDKGGDEYRELLQRLKADFTNYKRRVENERQEYRQQANRDLVLRLLPALDDLRRALQSMPDDVAGIEWARGLQMAVGDLINRMGEEGLERIEAEGTKFDPQQHEALFCEEGPEEEGTVRTVCRDGYRLHDKVIRPAQVVVCEGPGRRDQSGGRQAVDNKLNREVAGNG